MSTARTSSRALLSIDEGGARIRMLPLHRQSEEL
jgi:hypothetical protein